jgi:tRNA(Ile)-lysidine synthase
MHFFFEFRCFYPIAINFYRLKPVCFFVFSPFLQKMDLLYQFNQFIKAENLFQPKDKLLLAVSGGVDSVVLCELCHQSGFDFVIAHCNFQLRGEESERDEAFVRGLGEKYGVEVLVKRFDTALYANEHKLGIQEAARSLRYSWFLHICAENVFGKNYNAKNDKPGWHFTIDDTKPKVYVATAHHANDSAETLLMNFFKGTGIRGLQGIKSRHELLPYLIRPLLFAKKEELSAFSIQNKLSFVEDSSNASDKYTRNYFRNQLIPSLKKMYPEVEDNLIGNLNRFRDIEMLYQQSIQLHKKKLLEKRGEEIHIPVLKLLKTVPLTTVIYEIIQEFNFSSHQTGIVINLLNAESGKYVESGSHMILKNRNWLIITPIKSSLAANILIEASDKKIEFDTGVLNIQTTATSNFKLQISNLSAQLDAAQIKFPLLLRKWKQGDYFYPLGMTKKKKLSRFFIDQKLSLIEKENTWVIEMDKKIIWVVGMRIDNRFKITLQTTNILVIHYEPK